MFSTCVVCTFLQLITVSILSRKTSSFFFSFLSSLICHFKNIGVDIKIFCNLMYKFGCLLMFLFFRWTSSFWPKSLNIYWLILLAAFSFWCSWGCPYHRRCNEREGWGDACFAMSYSQFLVSHMLHSKTMFDDCSLTRGRL